jgi:hypothetical protein
MSTPEFEPLTRSERIRFWIVMAAGVAVWIVMTVIALNSGR